ncbi:MAG: GDYXXLXY domain-containing protein [Kiritimatiellae bacterium]|jgi:uncharacterized membrane-anchored protein|nr:GDYXXLXY domain-containing protein [Kiritimatiellia bacterium]
MKTQSFLIVATSAFILHAGIMAYMIIKREITLDKGERFSFKTAPVDPHDAFRGKFVRVDIDGDGPFTNKVEYKRGQKLYAPLGVDADGLAVMTDILIKPPKDDPYIKVKCSRCYEDRVKTGVVDTNFMYYCQQKNDKYRRWRSEKDVARYNLTYDKVRTNTVDKYKYTGKYVTKIEVPFDRYYMDEKLAPRAEQAYRDNSRRGKQDAVLNVRVRNGYALIESLEVGGVPIRDLAKE